MEDLDKANVLELNITFILSNHGYVKNILKDYQRALEDFHKVDVLKPKNAKIFYVKNILEDYQRTLEDLGNVDVLEPNNVFRVKTHYVVDNFRESWDYM